MAKNKSKTSNKSKSAAAAATPKTQKPTIPRRELPEWAIVGFLLLLTVLIRWQFLDIPLERDESVYYYLGRTALDGGRPYHDFYEMKPPGLFYSYALLVAFFGYSGVGAHLSLLFVSLSNTIFTYLIGRKLAGKSTATIAALAFIFFSLDPGASGMYLEAEHVALLWGLPGIWLALQYPERTNKYLLLLSGFLLSFAVLVKQTAGVFGLAITLYWLTCWFQDRKSLSWKPLLWWLVGGIIPLFGAWLIIWASGTMEEAIFWLSEYPKRYVVTIFEDKIGLYFRTSWRLVSSGYEGYFGMGVLGLVVLWWSRLPLPVKVFMSSWALLSILTVVPGMRFYGHYYLLAFPAACIAGAMLFYTIAVRISASKQMPIALLALGLLWSVHHVFVNAPLYIRPNLWGISRTYSPGNPFIEHQILSKELEKVLQPNDTVAVFGSDPQYFIYLDKKSPIRHVYMPFISKGQFPQAQDWQVETMQRLKETRPKYVIFNGYPYAWMTRYDMANSLTRELLTYLQSPEYEPFMFIETDSKSKPATVKYKVQQGAVTNNVYFIQVFKRRD